ncbi:unnamed protein product [Psylliodes chrysocephalus]|uniref:Uncharacterized protein n=1 Tax=Psylliodes chrysocephalus TaxID=3402493 RepID=A0A9P0CKW8_9CUCU|nr:unnamed protein product [Psylliodes chrysocephala]
MEDQLTLQSILDEIQNSKNDLINVIEASKARLRLEIERQNNKIKQSTKENTLLKEKIEILDSTNRKNNIIIFILNKSPQDATSQLFRQELKQLLEVDLNEKEINDIYYLGKLFNAPIKVELTTYLQKRTILKNCYKLKGLNVSIVNDLAPNQREEQKILRYCQRIEREKNNNSRCYIKHNKLIIDDNEYTIDELAGLEHPETEIRKASSVPRR